VEWVSELIALMMEAVQTSETLVNSHQSTRRYKPEDSHLHHYRYWTPEYHIKLIVNARQTSTVISPSATDRLTSGTWHVKITVFKHGPYQLNAQLLCLSSMTENGSDGTCGLIKRGRGGGGAPSELQFGSPFPSVLTLCSEHTLQYRTPRFTSSKSNIMATTK
jgi:hypothetical protein